MTLLAPISHGFLEDDDGAPGLYVTDAGVVVIRSAVGGPLVPVGGGGGGAASPLVLTSGDQAEVPLTINADPLQTASLIEAYNGDGDLAFVIRSDGGARLPYTQNGQAFTGLVNAYSDTSAFPGDSVTQLQATGNAGQPTPVLVVNDGGFNPILRVDEDGSVHIKTGTSVIADL